MLTRLFHVFLLSYSLFVSSDALAANNQGAATASEVKPDDDKIKTLEFEITEPTELTFNKDGKDATCTTCADGELNIIPSGGTSPFKYSIDGGLTYSEIYYYDNKLPGDYNVVVKDANGCTSAQTVKVENTELQISSFNITQANCGESNGGIDVTIQGGTPPYKFTWSNGTDQEDLSNVKSGIYLLNVTDADGEVVGASYTLDASLRWDFTQNVSVDNSNTQCHAARPQ